MARRRHGALFFVTAVIAGGLMAGGGTKAIFHDGGTSLDLASGTLDCSQLERLWESAGGSSAAAFTAAEIARAESSGEQYAKDDDGNGTVDYGYWQINSSNGGSPASYNPMTNAREAVSLYDADGWHPWITWRHGAEIGQC
jgi:Lysozyme like domain